MKTLTSIRNAGVAALCAGPLLALSALPSNASVQESLRLVNQGNNYMQEATRKAKNYGLSASCSFVKRAADSYASAYAMHPHEGTLELMTMAHNAHQKFC